MYKKITETNVKQGYGMLFLLIVLITMSSHYSYAMRPNFIVVDMSNKPIPAGAVVHMVDDKIVAGLVMVNNKVSISRRPNLVDAPNQTIPVGTMVRMVNGKLEVDPHSVTAASKSVPAGTRVRMVNGRLEVVTKDQISNDQVKQLSADVAKREGTKRVTFDQNGNLIITLEQKK